MRFLLKPLLAFIIFVLFLHGMLHLYSNMLQPTRGRITVAGEDLRTFDKSEWARVVSIVNQVIILFSLVDFKHLIFDTEFLVHVMSTNLK